MNFENLENFHCFNKLMTLFHIILSNQIWYSIITYKPFYVSYSTFEAFPEHHFLSSVNNVLELNLAMESLKKWNFKGNQMDWKFHCGSDELDKIDLENNVCIQKLKRYSIHGRQIGFYYILTGTVNNFFWFLRNATLWKSMYLFKRSIHYEQS